MHDREDRDAHQGSRMAIGDFKTVTPETARVRCRPACDVDFLVTEERAELPGGVRLRQSRTIFTGCGGTAIDTAM